MKVLGSPANMRSSSRCRSRPIASIWFSSSVRSSALVWKRWPGSFWIIFWTIAATPAGMTGFTSLTSLGSAVRMELRITEYEAPSKGRTPLRSW